MADNYTFKDGANNVQQRAAKEIIAGVFANKDIEYLENGSPAKTCNAVNFVTPGDSGVEIVLLPQNLARKGLIIVNVSTANMFIKYGAGVDTNYKYTVKIVGEQYWEMPYPIYTGLISAIWRQPSGFFISVTELI